MTLRLNFHFFLILQYTYRHKTCCVTIKEYHHESIGSSMQGQQNLHYNGHYHPYRSAIGRAGRQCVSAIGNFCFLLADRTFEFAARRAGYHVGNTVVSNYYRQITDEIFSELSDAMFDAMVAALEMARANPEFAAFLLGVFILFYGGMTPAEWAYQIARSAFLQVMARRSPWWARPIFWAAGY